MADKKLITVFGATGAQGGGLARAILNDPNSDFRVRAVTRDASSDKAQSLKSKGAEVVEADLEDPESVKAAMEGAYGAYCVTFYWEHMNPGKEIEHAKTLAEAADKAGVQHVVWSTLEDTRKWVPTDDDSMPTLMDNYKVPHFDTKGFSNRFFEERNVPTTYLLTSFYWDNFIYFGLGPQKDADGNYAIPLPLGDKKLPGIAAEDIGKAAYGIFKAGEKYIGETVGIAGAHLTGEEMAKGMANKLGEPIHYNDVPAEVYRSFDFPGSDDMGNMFQFKRDYNDYYTGVRSVQFTRDLNPDLMSYQQWLDKYGDNIPMG